MSEDKTIDRGHLVLRLAAVHKLALILLVQEYGPFTEQHYAKIAELSKAAYEEYVIENAKRKGH